MAIGPRQTLGSILNTCLKRAGLTTQELAARLIAQGFMPGGIRDADILEGLLDEIVADRPWPFSFNDIAVFCDHCKTCLKGAGHRNLFALALALARLAGGSLGP